jgi:hypothetical protein
VPRENPNNTGDLLHHPSHRRRSVAATRAAATFNGAPAGPYPNAFNAANVVETFSSDGPRRIFFNADSTPITPGNFLGGTNGGLLRQKPDITAADGTRSVAKTDGTLTKQSLRRKMSRR